MKYAFEVRNLQAALWGAVCALGATVLTAQLYGMIGPQAFTRADMIPLAFMAVSDWQLYLVPGLVMGVVTRWIVRRFGALLGGIVATVLAALCGGAVGYLFTVGATHVLATRAAASVAVAWCLTALAVLALFSRRIAGLSRLDPVAVT